MMDSLMRLISFLPGCSPCFTFMLLITFFHPAYTLSLFISSRLASSFLTLSAVLYLFSCSFPYCHSSSYFLACYLRACFCSYSLLCIYQWVHFFPWGSVGYVLIIRVSSWWAHLIQNHQSRHWGHLEGGQRGQYKLEMEPFPNWFSLVGGGLPVVMDRLARRGAPVQPLRVHLDWNLHYPWSNRPCCSIDDI